MHDKEPMARPFVLLIDPFRDEGEMYSEYLRAAGFDVSIRRNAVDAIASIDRRRPSVVVTRLRQLTRDLSGLDVVDHIKHALPSVPVIMITSSILDADREAAARANCDAYMLIPVVPEQLEAAIRRLISVYNARTA